MNAHDHALSACALVGLRQHLVDRLVVEDVAPRGELGESHVMGAERLVDAEAAARSRHAASPLRLRTNAAHVPLAFPPDAAYE
ncbi:MAG: hypothetical protein ABTQ28_01100 [Thauera sp.]